MAFGLGALLAVLELVYTLLKWCGAGYLCWLGIQFASCARQQFNNPFGRIRFHGNWFLLRMLECLTQNGRLLRFVLPSLSRGRFTHQLDLSRWSAIHVLIGTLWSLTLITATRYAADILKTSRGEMDGSNDRLPVSPYLPPKLTQTTR